MTIDHVYPKAKGGTLRKSNIKPCCTFCNMFKGSLSVGSFRQKLLKEVKEHGKLEHTIKRKFNIDKGNITFYFETVINGNKSTEERLEELYKTIAEERKNKK